MRTFILAALVLVSCAAPFESMAWPVACDAIRAEEIRRLDQRYREEVAALEPSGACMVGTPMPGFDNFQSGHETDCPAFHRIWRRYWMARRALDRCEAHT